MTFARVKPGGHVTGERLLSTVFDALDLNVTRSLDGYAGGTYTPSAAIKMAQATLELNGIGEHSGEFRYVNGSSVATPKSRTMYVSVENIVPAAWDSQYYFANGSSVRLYTSNVIYNFPLPRLPYGSTITQVDVMAQPGAARATNADRIKVELMRITSVDFATPTAPVLASASETGGSQYDDGTANLQVISQTYTETVGDYRHYLHIESGSTAASFDDEIYAIRIMWTDPGPRNY